MNIRNAILAESLPLPPIQNDLMYQFVVAGNGIFIRAEDSRMEAMVPVALAHVHGLEYVVPHARLKVPRVEAKWLWSIHKSARQHLPNEAMYQFRWSNEGLARWKCTMPQNLAEPTPGALTFDDDGLAVIDLHSHGTLEAFFSENIDDADEQGLRFYAVVGHVDQDFPQIEVRVGVYGHTWNVPQTTVFEGGPFVQVDPEAEAIVREEESC